VDEVTDRLQRDFLLVSTLSGIVFGSWTWLVDSGTTCHITRSRELFESFRGSNSNMYMELGMGTQHAMQGFGIVPFHMNSGGVLRVTYVLWVSELRRSMISVSMIEKKSCEVLF
jgi:hypothetical protein